MTALASTIHPSMRVVNACKKSCYCDVLHTCYMCMIVYFEHRSLIRFPRITGYFWAERTCAVKRGLTVRVKNSVINNSTSLDRSDPCLQLLAYHKSIYRQQARSLGGDRQRYEELYEELKYQKLTYQESTVLYSLTHLDFLFRRGGGGIPGNRTPD